MIVVDSSVWIDYFNGTLSSQTEYLHKTLGNELVAAGDLIMLEVLQGFRRDADYEQARELFTSMHLFEMLSVQRAQRAAAYYRRLRKRGITIRKTADVIIAAFCIDERLPLLFSDRDFEPFIDHFGLSAPALP